MNKIIIEIIVMPEWKQKLCIIIMHIVRSIYWVSHGISMIAELLLFNYCIYLFTYLQVYHWVYKVAVNSLSIEEEVKLHRNIYLSELVGV